MNVIVKTSGFYGGTWYEAGKKEVTMPDKVASQFLPPYGDQLDRAPVKAADTKTAPTKADAKKAG